MTEIDDKLIKQFFSENKQEIADNGFTKKVIHSLPGRDVKLANIITIICSVVAFILFIALDGLKGLVNVAREVFISLVQNGAATFDLKTLLIVSAVLVFIGARKIYTME